MTEGSVERVRSSFRLGNRVAEALTSLYFLPS
jgi:hypothetical protein